MGEAPRLGAIGFDSVKQQLCQIEGRPPRLDLDLYTYLPRVSVKTTRPSDYMTLLSGRAAWAASPHCSLSITSRS